MSWQWTPAIIPALGAAVLSFAAALYVFLRRGHLLRARVGILLLLAGVTWMLSSALETASTDLQAKLLWEKIQIIGVCIVPTAWMLYAAHYTGRKPRLSPRRRALVLSAVPMVTYLLVLTNDVHHLIWTRVWLQDSDGLAVKQATYGIGYWVFLAYSYFQVFIGIAVLVQALVRSGRLFRWQATALLLAVASPWLASVADSVVDPPFLQGIDLTALALGLTVPLLAWGFFRLRQRDIVPVARTQVLEGMEDALLILDAEGRIADWNPAAQALFGAAGGLGEPLVKAWPEWPRQLPDPGNQNPSRQDVVISVGNERRAYDLRLSPLMDPRGKVHSQVITLRDVTESARRSRELATLLQSTKAVSSTLNLEEVLTLIAEEMIRTADVDGCTLSRWDRETDCIITWVERRRHWPESISPPGTSYPLVDFPATRHVLETGRPLTVFASDPAADRAEVALMREAEYATLLMFPLAVGERTIGLVELDLNDEERRSRDEEIRLCRALADQAAIAIEHARLYEDSRRRQDELSSLFEAGIALNSSLDRQQILDTVALEIVSMLNSTSAYVCHWDEQAGATTVIAEALTPRASAAESVSDLGVSYADDLSTVKMLRPRRYLILRASDPDLPDDWKIHLAEYGGQCVLLLNLHASDADLTYIEVWESRPGRVFTESDILLGMSLASQAAVALENARLHAETQRRLGEQTVLRETRAILTSTLDRAQVLNHIAEQLLQAVDATSAYICSADIASGKSLILAEAYSPEATPNERISDLGEIYQEDDLEFLSALSQGLPYAGTVDELDRSGRDFQHYTEYDARSVLAVPLFTGGQAVGYAELWDSRYPREFSQEEINLCQDLARNAAIALENARLFEQAQQEIRERAWAEEQMTASLREKEVLLQEIHHRVKNNLQIISSLLNLQSRRLQEPAAFELLQDSRNRVHSMALIHEQLYQAGDLAQIDFGDYLGRLIANLSRTYSNAVKTEVRADRVHLEIDTAVPCGLILNELVTNAFKHAFPPGCERSADNHQPLIRIQLTSDVRGQVALTVSDNGAGLPPDFDWNSSGSLGTMLIHSLVNQLDGVIEIDRGNGEGTCLRVIFSPQGARGRRS